MHSKRRRAVRAHVEQRLCGLAANHPRVLRVVSVGRVFEDPGRQPDVFSHHKGKVVKQRFRHLPSDASNLVRGSGVVLGAVHDPNRHARRSGVPGQGNFRVLRRVVRIARFPNPGTLFAHTRLTLFAHNHRSFWAFFAATQWCFLVTSLYLFVEGMAGCTEQRRRRFGVFGTRGAHVVGDGKVSPNKPRTSHDGRRSSAGTSGGGAVAHEDGGKMPVG